MLDTELFLFLNGLHADWLDPIMIFISGKITWLPFYLVLLYLVIKNYKKQSILIILGIILLIVCSDQVSSSVFKPLFERPRPCHNEALRIWFISLPDTAAELTDLSHLMLAMLSRLQFFSHRY